MNRKFRLFLSVSLMILLIFLVSRSIHLDNLSQTIWNFPKDQLILFFGLSFAMSFLKAFRFLLLLHNAKIPITLWESSKVYIASQLTTPLPGGETLRAILVHHETEKPIKNTTAAIITQGFLEITSAATIMIIGSLYFHQVREIGLTAFIVLSILSAMILNEKISLYMLNKLPHKRFYSKIRTKLVFIQKGFLVNINDPRHSIFKTFFVSIGTHLLGGLLLFAIARSYNIDLNFFLALFIYSAGVVIQGLSAIIPGGIGVTEGGMTGLFLLNRVPFDVSIAIIFLYRIVTLLFSVVLGLLFFLFFYAYELLLVQQKHARS